MFLGDFFVDGSLVWACHGDGKLARTPYEWWPSVPHVSKVACFFLSCKWLPSGFFMASAERRPCLVGSLSMLVTSASSSFNHVLHRMLVGLSMRGWLCSLA